MQRQMDGRGRKYCDIEFSSEHCEFGGEMHQKLFFVTSIRQPRAIVLCGHFSMV